MEFAKNRLNFALIAGAAAFAAYTQKMWKESRPHEKFLRIIGYRPGSASYVSPEELEHIRERYRDS